MENKVEACSQCGNVVEGKIVRTDEQEVTRLVAKKGSNKVLIYIVGGLLGTFVFPVVGTFLGLVICFILVAYIDNYSNKVTDLVETSLFKTLRYEYTCPKCGHKWVREMTKEDDFTPIEILKKEKNDIVIRLEDSVRNQSFMSFVCGATTILCFLYCFFTDYRTSLGMKEGWFGSYEDFDYNFLWYFLAVVCFFAAIGFIFHIRLLKSKKGILTEVQNLSDEDFRRSPLRFRYR